MFFKSTNHIINVIYRNFFFHLNFGANVLLSLAIMSFIIVYRTETMSEKQNIEVRTKIPNAHHSFLVLYSSFRTSACNEICWSRFRIRNETHACCTQVAGFRRKNETNSPNTQTLNKLIYFRALPHLEILLRTRMLLSYRKYHLISSEKRLISIHR